MSIQPLYYMYNYLKFLLLLLIFCFFFLKKKKKILLYFHYKLNILYIYIPYFNITYSFSREKQIT